MKPTRKFSLLIGSAAIVAVSASAIAGGNHGRHHHGDQIVGLWSTEAMVGPCTGAPVTAIRNTLLFHEGGTVIEAARFPPNGAPNVAGIPGQYQRTDGLGTWTYDPSSRRYFLHLRFDNYVDGIYHGYSTVDRELVLSKRGMLATGPVRSARFLADGTKLNEVCGQATSVPL